MSDYNAEAAELERLVNIYNNLVSERNRLVDVHNRLVHELDGAITASISAVKNAMQLDGRVVPTLQKTEKMTTDVSEASKMIYDAIQSLQERYFIARNISMATKKLTELNDRYFTKFEMYHRMRRITLGYVIGIDSHIIGNESLREYVEKNHLECGNYWLSFALMSTVLWVSDAIEASERAKHKALEINKDKSTIYFMLLNLRFGRLAASRLWYSEYAKSIDVNHIGEEWIYILQTYLYRGFGSDNAFQTEIKDEFNVLFNKMKVGRTNFDQYIERKVVNYANSYAYHTKYYPMILEEHGKEYKEMMDLLSIAEKNVEFVQYYKKILETDTTESQDLSQRIEDVLYNLVSQDDDEEKEIRKEMRYQEYIIKARGNVEIALRMHQEHNPQTKSQSLDDVLFGIAFADINDKVDFRLRHFTIKFFIDNIQKGYQQFATQYRQQLAHSYAFEIDGHTIQVNETNKAESQQSLTKHFKKNKRKFLMEDKKLKVYTTITWVSILILAALITWSVVKMEFGLVSSIILIITVSSTILFSLLAMGRRKLQTKHLEERKQKAFKVLQDIYSAFSEWLAKYKEADQVLTVLMETLDQFKEDQSIYE